MGRSVSLQNHKVGLGDSCGAGRVGISGEAAAWHTGTHSRALAAAGKSVSAVVGAGQAAPEWYPPGRTLVFLSFVALADAPEGLRGSALPPSEWASQRLSAGRVTAIPAALLAALPQWPARNRPPVARPAAGQRRECPSSANQPTSRG